MSVTVINNNPKAEKLMPSSSGWQLYGQINAAAGALIYLSGFGDIEYPRPPDDMTADQARNAAVSIRFSLLGDSQYAKNRLAKLEMTASGLYRGNMRELIEYYVDWLETCGGYTLAG